MQSRFEDQASADRAMQRIASLRKARDKAAEIARDIQSRDPDDTGQGDEIATQAAIYAVAAVLVEQIEDSASRIVQEIRAQSHGMRLSAGARRRLDQTRAPVSKS